jgi:hypothetical protein
MPDVRRQSNGKRLGIAAIESVWGFSPERHELDLAHCHEEFPFASDQRFEASLEVRWYGAPIHRLNAYHGSGKRLARLSAIRRQ